MREESKGKNCEKRDTVGQCGKTGCDPPGGRLLSPKRGKRKQIGARPDLPVGAHGQDDL